MSIEGWGTASRQLVRPNAQVQAGPAGFMAGIAPGTES